MVLKNNYYFMIVIEPEHIELKVHHWTYLGTKEHVQIISHF